MHALRRRIALLLLAPVLALCASCRTAREQRVDPAVVPLRSSEMGSMHNVSVSGSIWFGGVPQAQDIDLAHRRGIRRVIALCDPSWREDELARRCQEHGLEFVRIPVREGDPVPEGSVRLVLDSLRGADAAPVLMFCDTGGKSAMFFALHRVLSDALDIEQALVEARRAGMKPGPSEEFVRAQADRLRAAPIAVGGE